MNKTICMDQFIKFMKTYDATNVGLRDRNQQRLGQAFLNQFPKLVESDPALFYETNYFVAKNMILTKYVGAE